jgi:Phosphotransferase enzyme family
MCLPVVVVEQGEMAMGVGGGGEAWVRDFPIWPGLYSGPIFSPVHACTATTLFYLPRRAMMESLPAKTLLSHSDELVLSYSDAELVQHISRCPTLSAVAPRIRVISPLLVAKDVPDDEAEDELAALEMAERLKIRAPIVRRVVKGDRVQIIMDRILGSTLAERWPHLGLISTIVLALQLRGYLRRLRSLTSKTVGSIGSGICRSYWVSDYYGLPEHATCSALDAFLGFWTAYKRKSSSPTLPPTRKLVLTHHDLAPRNLLVDASGNLWLVDWQLLGWYPLYFEYASMQDFEFHEWSSWARLRWWVFSWVSTGIYERERMLLGSIKHKCGRFPLARKSLLMEQSEVRARQAL